jgi:hypothetical protein
MQNQQNKPVYLTNKEIDKEKWDACISGAQNGLVYGYSFYLDHMSKHWDALIMNDYEAVMPLTWNKKYHIEYLYQPYFTASLGIFGNRLTATLVKIFLENIPSKYKYWDIYLNHENFFVVQGFEFYSRNNYILSLGKGFATIQRSYSQNHLRNIKKAQRIGLNLQKNIEAKKVIALARKQSNAYSRISAKDFKNFYALYKYLHAMGKANTYGVFNAAGELMSSCILFFSHKRIYFILAGNHPSGRTSGASHFLINEFIKEFAGKDLVLDFEGSDVHNIARFYKGFGATEENYPGLKLNRLPAFLKLFKK